MLWIGASLGLGAVLPLRQVVLPLADLVDLGVGVLFSSMLFFFLPLAFLAAVPPLAVKLSHPGEERLGRTVGEVSAVGTAGSCFGALSTGFFLVPHFPLSRLFFCLSLLLAFCGVLTFLKRRKVLPPLFFFVLWGGFLAFFSQPKTLAGVGGNGAQQPVVAADIRQSLYGQVAMLEIPSYRLLFLDGSMQAGTVIATGQAMVKCEGSMEMLGLSAVPKARHALVVGLGGGILPSLLFRRGLQVDTVEINPQMAEVCRKWFELPPAPAKLHLEDGRRFLRQTGETFDLIYFDAFAGDEIPTQMMTREAFQEARAHLSPEGALVLNYLGYFEGPSFRVLSTIAATLRAVYPSVDVFTSGSPGTLSNFCVVARARGGNWDTTLKTVWGGGTDQVVNYLQNPVKLGEAYAFLFTDDYCPLDWLNRAMRFQVRKENAKVIPLSTFSL
jgi:spermidine synthase